jgi:hypothetical protein
MKSVEIIFEKSPEFRIKAISREPELAACPPQSALRQLWNWLSK